MKIVGFQKMTLLNYPDHVAATIFTAGCNLRCPFCHNASIALDKYEEFSEQEILDYLNERKNILDGLCISGGEPLIWPDLKDFIIKVKQLGLKVKLDTNGSFPDRLIYLIDNKLIDYVAMDIKNTFDKYSQTVGINTNIDSYKKSIAYLLENHVDYEFRTTIVKELHTKEDIIKIAEYIKGAKKYYLQNFEDNDDLIAGHIFSSYDNQSLKSILNGIVQDVQVAELRGV